jgi:hypothetical protein
VLSLHPSVDLVSRGLARNIFIVDFFIKHSHLLSFQRALQGVSWRGSAGFTNSIFEKQTRVNAQQI